MTTIEATSGENIYHLIQRSKEYMRENYVDEVKLMHNAVVIRAYRNSAEYDLCEKFDMQRKIDNMSQQYRR